ncbi:MAG: M20/M25/M40 family metallo-hydrolase [Flavobacteriales bacterium]
MKIPLFALAVFGLVSPAALQAQLPAIQQIIDAVNIDSLAWRLDRLTGQVPVNVGMGNQVIVSRHKFQPGNALAAQWMLQEFTRMGYTPSVQAFGTRGENVLVEKPGLVHPERKVIICAHYDSMPTGLTGPGADDDGSGVCAVMEAARTMADHDFENTVVFALWDEEEQGLVGSAYYASAAFGNDAEIVAVLQMDAIGYDGDGDGLMRIHTRPVGNSVAIKDSALMVNTTYGLDLPILINNPGATYSDHASFWNQGYGAILVIEDFDNDPNPYYHTPNDRMEFMDLAYWHGLSKLTIGTTAALAIPTMGTAVPSASASIPVFEIYPNPVQDRLHVRFNADPAVRSSFVITDATGRNVGQAGPVGSPDGTMQVDVSELSPGAYVASFHAGSTIMSKRFLRLP